ncbi:hypothetical protein BCS84_18385 [Vibrio cyclitrophicus]|uniref:hypothetical protein n=1 Tax=Vibrio cyclitrophicus TaxID=47951 RepID=UPI00031AAB8F|nr:hypothetical protein [Vibrio cyclitrophicus]OED90508.1 hypothetical protein OAQ_16340 [Vibrio cyclitrophicus ZF30]PMP52673.1 hypothetical protein BCS84_20480 [Vibrio cyclitrophicus]
MISKGYMTYFSVEHCGLYKRTEDECLGLDIGQTFDLIEDWVDGRLLSTTIPWDPASTRDNKPRVYCKHIHKDPETGHFLVVLWKSDQHSSGTMLGVDENETTGSSSIVQTSSKHKGKNVIWGRPCYYWVIPEHDAVVSIKFEHSLCDADLFKDFVRCAMTNRVKHADRIKISQTGHAKIQHNSGKHESCLYRFNMKIMSMPTNNVSFQKLVNRITHIIERDTVIVRGKNARSEWVNKFNNLFPATNLSKTNIKEKRIEVKAEAKPTAQEVKDLVEKYALDNRSSSDWANVGFVTDKGILWADKYRLREEITLTEKGKKYFPADVLYSAIKGNLNRYVGPLSSGNNKKIEKV